MSTEDKLVVISKYQNSVLDISWMNIWTSENEQVASELTIEQNFKRVNQEQCFGIFNRNTQQKNRLIIINIKRAHRLVGASEGSNHDKTVPSKEDKNVLFHQDKATCHRQVKMNANFPVGISQKNSRNSRQIQHCFCTICVNVRFIRNLILLEILIKKVIQKNSKTHRLVL